MVSVIHTTPQVKKKFDWGFYTAPQQNGAGRRIPYVRGKVLGGSSSINGMVYVRGNRKNYDDWAADGCPGWGYADAVRCYKRLEDWERGADDHRGAGGPIAVTASKDLVPATEALIHAIAETCGVPVLDDYNGASQLGIGPCQMNARGGKRYSTSEAYVHPAKNRPNFRVQSGAVVTRIVFEGTRAVGVELLEKGQRRTVRATREVILSAGVIGSAQILMLSGVGPAADLQRPRHPPHRGPARRQEPARPPLRPPHLPRPRGRAPRHALALLRRDDRRVDQGRHVVLPHGLRRDGLRPVEPRQRRARPPDPLPPLVLPLPQPGQARAPDGRPPPRAHRAAHAHLPQEPRRGPPHLRGPDGRAAHRPVLPRRTRTTRATCSKASSWSARSWRASASPAS